MFSYKKPNKMVFLIHSSIFPPQSVFCKNTVETVSLKITKTQKESDTKLESKELEEINATLRKNYEINWKHLQQRKNKKITYLKFKPTRPINETNEFER